MAMSRREKSLALLKLMRFDKPIGILLLLWPTLWAVWIAGHFSPSLFYILIFTAGVVVMRAAGCIINDICDRKFDQSVERTKKRVLVTGMVTLKEAWLAFFVLCLIALVLVLLLNKLSILLAVCALAMTMIYPLLKRITHWPQLLLGIAFAWGVPMAFAAQQNTVPMMAWLLFVAAMIWPVAYDTVYAMVDRQDDIKIGVKSTAVILGSYDRLFVATLYMIFFAIWLVIAIQLQLKIWFYLNYLAAILIAIYNDYLIKRRDREKCFKAFLQSHWIGAFLFAGLVL